MCLCSVETGREKRKQKQGVRIPAEAFPSSHFPCSPAARCLSQGRAGTVPAGSRRCPRALLPGCPEPVWAASSPAHPAGTCLLPGGNPSGAQTATGTETQEVNGSTAHTTTEGANAPLKEGARLASWQTEMQSTAWHLGLPLELLEVDVHTHFDVLGQHGLLREIYSVCNYHMICRETR